MSSESSHTGVSKLLRFRVDRGLEVGRRSPFLTGIFADAALEVWLKETLEHDFGVLRGERSSSEVESSWESCF